VSGAAAVSVVLLLATLVVLTGINLLARRTLRHGR
jgi:ABC-type sulfate transport system permease component